MDQARWIVVFSVIFLMMTVLTILHRFSVVETINRTPIEKSEVLEKTTKGEKVSSSIKHEAGAWKSPAASSIKYSKPPAHVFAVEENVSFIKEEEVKEDKGRILE